MLSTQLIYEYKNSNSIIDIHPYAEILHGNNTRNPHGTIIMQMYANTLKDLPCRANISNGPIIHPPRIRLYVSTLPSLVQLLFPEHGFLAIYRTVDVYSRL